MGVSEPVIDLAIRDDGTLEEPDDWDDVGWFADGPRPGERGPTVFAGHVDSTSGPAVFFRVLELSRGDLVEVSAADGSIHIYRVDRVEDHPKDDFPTREVFGLSPEDELRLITCTGEFDSSDRRYLDNRVVFATAVG
ncbi:sortase [Dietzia natronolimnaea]|uniref:Sortase n=1 Tax=Dietzia natronolimnaea TaxID=161920 RepID=A0A2A2WP57_9ACTN|nr:sortase [Dietzia natronolimnaea]